MYNPRDPAQQAAYQAGLNQGRASIAGDVQRHIQELAQQKQAIESKYNRFAGSVRQTINDRLGQQEAVLKDFAAVAQALNMFVEGGSGASDIDPVLRIENIPGRRIPFTLLVDIEIGPNVTSVRQNSVPISQEGPFVATRRMAIFQSAYEYEVVNELTGNTARLAGRSFGRYRPIHSACDLHDAQGAAGGDGARWLLAASAGPPAAGTVLPTGNLVLPSNMSTFRSMEFDGRISVRDAGSSFPREEISVPTAFWTQELCGPFDLSALDFFERGSIITFGVQPTHVNNPAAGNVDGECIFPAAAVAAGGAFGYPFVGGQYDLHEGICTPNGVVMGAAALDYEPALTDPVSRVPNGVLTLGYEGYRIVQGVAPVP